MGKWYKIPKDSPTGKRLQTIREQYDVFSEAWAKYRERHGVKGAIYYVEHICDVLAFTFEDEPDATVWHQLKRGEFEGNYKPIKGTQAYKDWQKLRKMRVRHIELDRAMGDTGDFSRVGIHWGNDEFFFVHYKFGPKYELGEECEPISDEEYRLMTGDKKNWDE